MPLSLEQRQRVLEAITSGRLRLEPPLHIYAGYGDGTDCSACGEVIDKKQVEWEATYENGKAYRLHHGCAELWDAERRRHEAVERISHEAQQLRDRAETLAREAQAVIEEARRVKAGEQPAK